MPVMDRFCFGFAFEPHIWRSHKYHLGSLDVGFLYTLYRGLPSRICIRISYPVRDTSDLCSMNVLLTEAPVSWDDYKRVLSWFTAWANIAAWICLCATASLFGSQLVFGTVVLGHPDFNLQRWHVFLIYVGFNMIAFLVNACWNSILSALNRAALIWSLCGFSVIFITVLTCASPNYKPASIVIIGKQGPMAWLGFWAWDQDAVAHMIEEIPKPTVDGPLIMVACVAIGLATSLILIIALLFVSRDIDTIITSSAGPLLQIFFDATNSKVGSICLLLFPIGCLLLGVVAITTTSSRMIYALARDSGLPFSPIWTTVHARLKTPVHALALHTAAVICCGCIFLGSSSAFNALSSATVICFDISYCLPILIHCIRGRKLLPARPWSLYPSIGWIVNLVYPTFLFISPSGPLPMTNPEIGGNSVYFIYHRAVHVPTYPFCNGKNFHFRGNLKNLTDGWFSYLVDYAIATTGAFALLSAIYWFVRGQKRFMQVVVNAEIEFPEARTSIDPIKSDV
ncbi:Choline transporter [Penicillium verrucosum]|uniref:Choline transporter n=1 Tax=Penicillium verrucosum TaxID=60171 RepID=UPI0025456031|nr:Choline transporter [Penicillium verrucosum]KAJ5931422.1 Choline transporter [Penicillium verrucosum]